MPSTTPKDLTMQTRDFHLPPARAPPSLQPLHHLSQRLLPNPSDLIVHGAISAFNNEALLSPSPKQTWLQTGEDANSLIARSIKGPGESAEIVFLVTKNGTWMQYNPNYAGNVSHALRIVAMTAFQEQRRLSTCSVSATRNSWR
ncbi:hypothetical protein PCH_Pc13g02080 [Penicillium rubens Wisconsin 54-1255]|uniref:Uncharacterized protein n=1 Tax=Penicillium rubens (strain ATCC 28089 / DSM 1075 / NRRL 1951 / Wisconsin 54-1255) TaxID=500485 RepID=B6H1C8_PENRW|nr:hypothetical protein PCH_Pc13g02080 [Penicillium rubens Wisconsin 54-1255]